MNGRLTLKIFLSISLGLHLLFFLTFSLFYPKLKINPLPPLHMEVSLFHLISETKAIPKRISNAESKAKTFETPISMHEQNTSLLIEKEEDSLMHLEKKPESLSVQTEVKVLPTSHSSDLSFEEEKREVENLHPSTTSPEPFKSAKQSPSLSDGEILFVQPKSVENPKPNYPPEARRKGYEGEVILKVEVLSNGRVGQVEIKKSSGYEVLDRSALATIKQWKFVPAKKGEIHIPFWVNIPIRFQLQ